MEANKCKVCGKEVPSGSLTTSICIECVVKVVK